MSTVSIVTGDSIRIFVHKQKITGVEVIGSAVSTTTSTDTTGTLFDKSFIESAVMHLDMGSEYITQVSAEGTARSYYHHNKTQENDMFVNEATGDTLTFYFDKGKVTEMKIYGFGGGLGKGIYYEYEPEEISAESDSIGTQ